MLTCTSTLAVGVNLPAHLVILKNTQQYISGSFTEYDASHVLQMIGRAGRPQFDVCGKAVIITRESVASHYLELASGQKPVESHMHKQMSEHLNAEVALGTITDIGSALTWLKYSFLIVRVQKEPAKYGLSIRSGDSVEEHLQKLVLKYISLLADAGALVLDDDMSLSSTEIGRTMAKWSIAYETVKLLKDSVQRNKGLSPGDLLLQLGHAKEFSDIVLRNNEKKPLGTINRPRKKNAPNSTVRYPINIPGTGCIKNAAEKVSCISQCVFGAIDTSALPFALSMEVDRIMKVGRRVAQFFLEMCMQIPCNDLHTATFESAVVGKLVTKR